MTNRAGQAVGHFSVTRAQKLTKVDAWFFWIAGVLARTEPGVLQVSLTSSLCKPRMDTALQKTGQLLRIVSRQLAAIVI